MARKPREQSSTNTYHIMLRGVNRQQIFFDKEDYLVFMHLLKRYKAICGYRLHAYCIMGNHVHLLLQTEDEPLEKVMRRIEGAFVYWYNSKYERAGHLFQNRYRSEAVNTEAAFLRVLRYILRNPVKAGFCLCPEEYPYGSAPEYLLSGTGITDTELAFGIMNREQLHDYCLEDNEDQCLETEKTNRKRYTDTAAKEKILQEFGTFSPLTEHSDQLDLEVSIQKLIKSGVSIRQLSRLTGIPKKRIERCLKK